LADEVLIAVRRLVGDSLSELRAAVDGLPVEALNWRPIPDTNSIAILVAHTLGATRLWVKLAVGQLLPERDRDAEFRASASDATIFMRHLDSMARECLAALDSVESVDWSAMRATQGRGGDAAPEVSAAYAVIHVTEHLRGHVDQVSLMRQLWDARGQV
jgi:hypothetical protein